MSNNLKIGEVVRLKSGGPRMTIHNIGDYKAAGLNPGVLCVWFNVAQRMEAVFHPDTLEREEPKQSTRRPPTGSGSWMAS